jgi:hypothetical protein
VTKAWTRIGLVIVLVSGFAATQQPAALRAQHRNETRRWRPDQYVAAVVRQNPDSRLEITNVVAYQFEPDAVAVECAFFINRAPATAKHVQFHLAYLGADGSEVWHNTLDTIGTYGTGEPIEFWDQHNVGGARSESTCQSLPQFAHGVDADAHGRYRGFIIDPTPTNRLDKGVYGRPVFVTLAAWANLVEYADGTTWEGTGLAKDGYRGAILGSARQNAASRVKITDVFGTEFGRQSPSECVFFVNRADRSATAIRFSIAYVASDGHEIGTDTLTARGSFSPDVPIERWPSGSVLSPQCRDFSAAVRGGHRFLGLRPPREIMYGTPAQPVHLSATVSAVEYDDGTVWRAQ